MIEVGAYTGFPEMMDGRVKTLHPKVHGGLLQRRDMPEHLAAARTHDIPPIDLLVVNLYPFKETVAKGADFATCIENIDIGGPAMLRAAAKNHDFVTVVTDPNQYDALLAELAAQDGATTPAFRRQLAAAAYAHTASYDAAVSGWFAEALGEDYPATLTLAGTKRQALRYGENPHQSAAFYVTDARQGGPRPGLATAIQIQGKALSYNNLNDTDAGVRAGQRIHRRPRYRHHQACQSLRRGVRRRAGDRLPKRAGLRHDQRLRRHHRLQPADGRRDGQIDRGTVRRGCHRAGYRRRGAGDSGDQEKPARAADQDHARPAGGGSCGESGNGRIPRQSRDNLVLDRAALKCVTQRQPTDAEMRDMIFAFTVAKHVKSNTIVYAKDLATVGIGAGQMSRVDAAHIAARKAVDAAAVMQLATPLTQGCVCASDAFFPFADGLQTAIAAGATAVIQPGGSVRDADVIAAADAAGIAMVLTGVRHFRH